MATKPTPWSKGCRDGTAHYAKCPWLYCGCSCHDANKNEVLQQPAVRTP